MITPNKKLLKEFEVIVKSSEKAKKLAQTELDKIDEKYKALAEAEKKDLNETIKLLDEQISMYGQFLSSENKVEEQTEESVEEEEKVVDTLFTEDEKKETEEPLAMLDEDKAPEFDGAGFTEEDNVEPEATPVDESTKKDLEEIWPEEEVSTETENQKETSDDESDEQWPEVPEEWN